MRRSRLNVLALLAVLFAVGVALAWRFYEYLPWVGTHLRYARLDSAGAMVLKLNVQTARAIQGDAAGLEAVPQPSQGGTLQATLSHQGQKSGSEWLQTFRGDSIQSVDYAWQQKSNKDILTSSLDTRLGPSGGLLSVGVRPASRSVWLRPEVVTPWMLAMWPPFPARGIEPKALWNSQMSFELQPAEGGKPIQARWSCVWSYRGQPQGSDHQLAVLDVKGQASAEQPVDGAFLGEVVYSLQEQRVMACRGSFRFRIAAREQATDSAAVTVLDAVQGQFEVLRLVQDTRTPAATPAP
jgi:hypothetical protein